MAELGTVFVDVKGDYQGLESEGKSKFSTFGKIAAGAFVAAFAVKQVFDFGKDAFLQAEEYGSLVAGVANLVENQTAALGEGATLSTDSIVKMADSLQDLTGFSNEQILSGQKQLLTFQGIQNEGAGAAAIFDRASLALADMVASGALSDFNAGAIQMGKVLENPTKGVTALQRAGVAFTESQKEQIKALQASGDTLGAQIVILDEIEKVYGGTAAATRDDSKVMANSMQDVKVAIGTAIAPIVTQLVPIVKDVLAPALANLAPLFTVMGEGLLKLLPPVVSLIERLSPLVEKILPPFIDILLKVIDVVLALAEPLIDLVLAVLDPLIDIVLVLADDLIDALMPAILAVAEVLTALTPLLLVVIDYLKPLFAIVGALAKILGEGLAAEVRIVSKVLGFLIEKIIPVIKFFTNLWTMISDALNGVLPKILDFFRTMPTLIVNALKGAGQWLVDTGRSLIEGLINGIKSMAGKIVQAIKDFVINKIPGPIKSFFGLSSPSKLMMGYGHDIAAGVALGISEGGSMVSRAVEGLLRTPAIIGVGGVSLAGVGGGLSMTFNAPVGGDMGVFADQVARAQAREQRFQLG